MPPYLRPDTLLKCLVIALAMSLLLASPARALSLLRDPDIDHASKRLAAPLLKSAGHSLSRVSILLIDDSTLNAFVVDRDNIFVNSGPILKMDSPQMIQGVIGHEAAHIANGRLVRRPINLRNARTVAGPGMVLVATAGATSGNVQDAAVRYRVRAGLDPTGMTDMMQIFRGQKAPSVARQDPYSRTHPLTADRMRVLGRLTAAFEAKNPPSNSDLYWFARTKGKLSAFQRNPKWTLARAGESGFADVGYMREAIAWHRQSNLKKPVGKPPIRRRHGRLCPRGQCCPRSPVDSI